MGQLIPEEVVQEVRLRADIVDVIGDYVQLKQTGANAKGLCPFHQEKTPSFNVSPAKGLFYCFGCHASGDVYRFLMQYESLAFPDAVRFLAARYGVGIPDTDAAQRQEDSVTPQIYALHQAASTFFYTCLMRDPAGQAARVACRQRQITPAMAMRFGLGYAPATWETLYTTMRHQGFSQDIMLQSGLVVARDTKEGVYDRFRNRLMFTIHDRLGRPVAFGGRMLEGSEGGHVPKYLNSPETLLFHKGRLLYGFAFAKAAMRQHAQVLIVEGYTDVIACHRQSVTHVVGTMGTALTEHHVRLLKGMVKEVVLVFDGDAAGGAATERSIGLFLDAGMRVRVVTLPEGEDPDSFLRQATGEEFLQYVHTAVDFVDYLLTRMARVPGLQHPTAQADCVARLAPLLRKVESEVERWGYAELVSKRLGIPYEVLQREMYPPQTARDRMPSHMATRASRPPSATKVLPEYTLLQLLCHDIRLLEQVQSQLIPEEIQDTDLRAIYTLFIRRASMNEAMVFPNILDDAATPHQAELIGQMAMAPALTTPDMVAKAVRDCLAKIRQRTSKAASERLQQRLKTVADGTPEQEQILQEIYRLAKQHSSPTPA